jgi:hypothetical protein
MSLPFRRKSSTNSRCAENNIESEDWLESEEYRGIETGPTFADVERLALIWDCDCLKNLGYDDGNG